jgi:hypothetical protein
MPEIKKTTKKAVSRAKKESAVSLEALSSHQEMDHVIRERAYFIWEEKNRLHGSELENWLQAKSEILGMK